MKSIPWEKRWAVIGIDIEGSECCVARDLTNYADASKLAEKTQRDYPEWRVLVEWDSLDAAVYELALSQEWRDHDQYDDGDDWDAERRENAELEGDDPCDMERL